MTETNTQIYLDLTSEAKQLLSDNGLSISDILREQNIDAEVTYGLFPDQEGEGARSMEVVTILLASGAVAMMVGMAVSRVLQTLQHRPHLVGYYDLVPIKDAEGKIILDKKGKPQLQRVKKFELLEPRKADSQQVFELGFTPSHGLVIKFGTADMQMEPPAPSKDNEEDTPSAGQ
jgi:hypothetical protein